MPMAVKYTQEKEIYNVIIRKHKQKKKKRQKDEKER